MKKYESLDNIGILGWALMDVFWMYQLDGFAIIAAVFGLTFTFLSLFLYEGALKNHYANVSSFVWFFSNFLWAISEIFHEPQYLFIARTIAVINLAGMLLGFYSFRRINLHRKLN